MKTSDIIEQILAGKRQLTESLQRGGARVKNGIREKTETVKSGVNRAKLTVTEKATEYLVREALNRDEPRAMTKIIAAMENVIAGKDFMNTLASSKKKLEETPTERIELLSHDGELLIGHLRKCDNPKRIVIAMHGWRSSWGKDFGLISDFFERSECDVLYVEQRGQNESSGEYMGFGLMERYDCMDWINYVMENMPAKLPIYLHGVSMGAATVLMTTGFQLGGRVHGVVADCGYTSPDAICMKVANENFHVSYKRVSGIAKELFRQKINLGMDEYSTLEAMKVNKTPILFVHGSDDHFVPVEMTLENYKACKSTKKLFIVEGADHAMSYYKDPKGYEAVLTEFYAENDDALK